MTLLSKFVGGKRTDHAKLIKGYRTFNGTATTAESAEASIFQSYAVILSRLERNFPDQAECPDGKEIAMFVRSCYGDPFFTSNLLSIPIATSLLGYRDTCDLSTREMMSQLALKVLSESDDPTEEHLSLFQQYRSLFPETPSTMNLIARFISSGRKISDRTPKEIALWLDLMNFDKNTPASVITELQNHAVKLLMDPSMNNPQISPETVSLLLRSLSYSSSSVHQYRRAAVVGAFKQIIPQFDSFSTEEALRCMRSIRRMYPGHSWRRDLDITEFLDLIVAEILRTFHSLKPSDILDCFQVYPDNQRIRESCISILTLLTPRQVALGFWTLVKHVDDVDSVKKFSDYLETLDSDQLSQFDERDWALILHSLSSIPSHYDIDVNLLVENFFSICNNLEYKNLDTFSTILTALIRLGKGRRDGRIEDITRIHLLNLVNEHRFKKVPFSTKSILSVLHSLATFRNSSSHLISEMGRILYARATNGDMTSNQAAESLILLKREDPVIFTSFIPLINPSKISSQNLINIIEALAVVNDTTDLMTAAIDELYLRELSPNEFVSAVIISGQLDQRTDVYRSSKLIQNLTSKEILEKISASLLVQLFVNLEPVLGVKIDDHKLFKIIRENISIALIETLKSSSHCHWSGEDLVLMAKELVRLGPKGVKPNLKDRFLVRLMIGIKTRSIPTPLLLANLKLIDALGTFDQLPMYLQEHLYRKATPEQREGVRRPCDARNRKQMGMVMQVDEKEAKNNEEEETELNETGETAVSIFIQTIRQYK